MHSWIRITLHTKPEYVIHSFYEIPHQFPFLVLPFFFAQSYKKSRIESWTRNCEI